MEKGQSFKPLANHRYFITSSRNDGLKVTPYNFTFGTAGSSWELVLNVTYAQLCNALKQHFGINEGEAKSGSSQQACRNHLSTLNTFLASVGKTTDSRVGVELGSGFDQALRHYLEIVQVAPRTKRDRRNHLRLVQRLNAELATGKRTSEHSQTSLSLELRAAIARSDLSPGALAKSVRASPRALKRWLKGAMPSTRGISALRRLETALALPRDHLVNLLPKTHASAGEAPASIAFRKRQKELSQTRYLLPESELSGQFLDEWRALLNYKTTVYTPLERRPRAEWRLIPVEASVRTSKLAQCGEMACPTGNIALERIRAFFGVILGMNQVDGGLPSYDGEALPQTLAWLAHPGALEKYLEWVTARSKGLRHNGQKVFCRLVAGLLRPSTGYLWQNHTIASRLPPSYAPATDEAWRKMCEESHKLVNAWNKKSADISRDPTLPIAHLLELEHPLVPVLEAIDKIEQEAASAPSGSLSEALLRRDALLLGMLLANPLRLRVFISMRWLPDDTGELRGSASTGWRIHIQRYLLKNGAPYDVRVAEWLRPKLEAYLEEYRQTILDGKESPYLFVTSRSTGRMEKMGALIRKLTRRYVSCSPGFGSHAFRHLVATVWLSQHPNDFLTVAELLNDRLETVMEHYAHLKKDTSFLRYEEHVNNMLKRP